MTASIRSFRSKARLNSDKSLIDFVSKSSKEDLIRFAKMADHVERYEDMAVAMKFAATKGSILNTEEQNLLSIAYKHILGVRRSSWRIVSEVEMRAEDHGSTKKLFLVTQFRQQIEDELNKICKEILGLLEECLIPCANSAENKVYYYKMQGDYLRYMAEIATGDERKTIVEKAEQAYKTATESANNLLASHPIRLGLALNYAVFFYETRNETTTACQMARTAFEGAVDTIDSEKQDTYNDSALIMQLLRDNLTMWTADQQVTEEFE